MTKKDKIPVAIYQVDKSSYNDDFNFNDLVEDIIKQINSKSKDKWTQQNVVNSTNETPIKIFHSESERSPSWKQFLMPALHKDSSLNSCKNISHRFICFIGIQKEIFLIAGGIGSFHFIDPFITQTFGLDILVRIIEKNSPVIKGIQDRGVTGILLGQSRFFRDDQKLADDDDFGKIYKEVKAELQQRILVKDFKFSKESLRKIKSGCLAKSSFQINKAISFNELISLVQAFENIISKRDANFNLNKVRLIDKKHNSKTLSRLTDEFIDKLFNNYKKSIPLDVDFLNKNYVAFLQAKSYTINLNQVDILSFDDTPTFVEIINLIIKNVGAEVIESVECFKNFVLLRELISWDENEEMATRGTILQHLNGELKFENQNYFFIDEQWYLVDSSFISDLNKECFAIIQECWDPTLINKSFDIDKDEKVFNRQFIGQPNWIVLDTITPNNIELCDLLHYTDSAITLVHVKKGFDNSLRDLTAQINIAARLVYEDSRNNYSLVEQYQTQTLKGIKSKSSLNQLLASQKFPEEGLKNKFQNIGQKNIGFCLAVADTGKTERCLNEDLNKFHSNIAKYFLIQIYRSVVSSRFDFKIVQLKVE